MICSNGVTTGMSGVYLGWEAVGSSAPFDGAHKEGAGDGWTTPKASQSNFFLQADRFVHKLCATSEMFSAYRIRLATQAARGLNTFGERVAASGAVVGLTAAGNQEHVGPEGHLQSTFV